MKLLVVSNMYPSKEFPSYGVFVKNFCTQLETLGIDYRLAVMKKGNSRLQKLFGYVGFYLKSFFCSLLGSYDAVYVHYASHSSAGVLLARKLRKFTVYTNCHGSDVIPQNPQQERMQKNTRAILGISEKIVVPSDYFKKVVGEKYGIGAQKLFVCASGGVEPGVFHPQQKEKTGPFTIGFVSRITRGKGWDVLLQACAKLPHRDFRLLLVGDGPQKEQMLQLLGSLGLEDRAEVLGLQPQSMLGELYSRMDVFVFPTELEESLGLVAIEAMACGTPVIASDFAAPAYYVADGENGYKFPVGDARALAKTLEQYRLLTDEKRQALRAGALATAQCYTRDKITQVLGKILLE